MIKAIYEKQDDIPKEYLPLYAEKNGSWELTGIEGIYTKGNIERIEGSLKKEREDHKGTKEKLSAWNNMDPKESIAKLDKYPELEALAEGKDMNDEKIEKIVESRFNTKMGPIAREMDQLKESNAALGQENEGFKVEGVKRKIKDHVTKAAVKSNVIGTATEDIVMFGQNIFEINPEGNVRTKENVGVTPGIDGDVWLTEMQKAKPHWWLPSSGGGGKGGSGNGNQGVNPWSKNNWNLTEQGRVVREQGLPKAEEYAKSADSKVGATKPTEPAK